MELNGDVQCDQCPRGYFGTICNESCHEGCQDQLCNKYRVCQGCSRGYYYDPQSLSTCSKCPENCDNSNSINPVCKLVNEQINCTQCKFQFFGDDCSDSCSNCPNGCNRKGACNSCDKNQYHDRDQNKCVECPSTCQFQLDESMCIYTESQPLKCTHCNASNVYGDLCDKECNEKCKNGCDRNTGKCNGCKDDKYFGDLCENKCSSNCSEEICSQDGQCKSCVLGSYGNQCDKECGEFCNEATGCEQFTGKCIGCDGYHSGDYCQQNCSGGCLKCKQDTTCEECMDDYYKLQNDHQCTVCPSTCIALNNNVRCEKNSGLCSKCSNGFGGDYCEITCPNNCNGGCKREEDESIKCNGCKENWYKPDCSERCPEGCQNVCDQDTGKCTTCEIGYFEQNGSCVKCPSNCDTEICSNEGNCFECKIGYYGEKCDKECGKNCLSTLGCDQKTGNCTKCGETYWGPDCESCNENCIDLKCDENTGKCKECKNTSFGDFCTENCSSNCLDNICNQDGKCKSCITGKFGYNCSQDCKEKTVKVHVIKKVVIAMLVNLIIMETNANHVQRTVKNQIIHVTDLQEGVIYVSKDFGERNVHKIVVNFFVKIHVSKLLEYVIHVK